MAKKNVAADSIYITNVEYYIYEDENESSYRFAIKRDPYNEEMVKISFQKFNSFDKSWKNEKALPSMSVKAAHELSDALLSFE